MRDLAIQLVYLVATGLFIFSLYWMKDPKTARQGVLAGVAAMCAAILGTLVHAGDCALGLDRRCHSVGVRGGCAAVLGAA